MEQGAPVALKTPDGTGVRRKSDPAVDASGETAQGEPFADIAALQKLVLAQPEIIAPPFVSQMLTYETDAEPSYAKLREVERILAETKAANFGIRSLIHAMAESRSFLSK